LGIANFGEESERKYYLELTEARAGQAHEEWQQAEAAEKPKRNYIFY